MWKTTEEVMQIDSMWASPSEVEHRRKLANIVARFVKPRIGSDGEELPINIFDMGCGTGRFYQALARRIKNLDYFGIDNSRPMLAIASSRHKKAHFEYADANNLYDIPDNFVDYGVCFEVLGHMPSYEMALHELVRVSRLGILVSFWVTNSPEPIQYPDNWEYPHDYIINSISQCISDCGKSTPEIEYERVEPVTVYKCRFI